MGLNTDASGLVVVTLLLGAIGLAGVVKVEVEPLGVVGLIGVVTAEVPLGIVRVDVGALGVVGLIGVVNAEPGLPRLRLVALPPGTSKGLAGVANGLEVPPGLLVLVPGLGEVVLPLGEIALPPVVVPGAPLIGGALLGALGRPGATVVSKPVEGESGGKGDEFKGLGAVVVRLLGIWLILVERGFFC